MREQTDIIEVASLARWYLPELIGEDEARGLDEQLGAALSAGEVDVRRLEQLLASFDEVDAWAAEVLDDPMLRPPDLQGVRSVDAVSAQGAIRATRYACPTGQCHTVWWRDRLGRSAPSCDHGKLVQRAP